MPPPQFKVRPYVYLYCTATIFTLLVMMLGSLMKDTESVVVAYDSTDGVATTTAEDVAEMFEALVAANATLDESPFNVTRHFSLRSFGAWRLVLVFFYLLHHTIYSFTHPHDVRARLPVCACTQTVYNLALARSLPRHPLPLSPHPTRHSSLLDRRLSPQPATLDLHSA